MFDPNGKIESARHTHDQAREAFRDSPISADDVSQILGMAINHIPFRASDRLLIVLQRLHDMSSEIAAVPQLLQACDDSLEDMAADGTLSDRTIELLGDAVEKAKG